jgi:hypothetical protein
MPNIVAVLRQEITRLARKEGRSHTQGLQEASARYRRDLAALKRDVAQLRAELGRLKRGAAKAPATDAAGEGKSGIRFTAKGLRSQRARLDFSAEQYGNLVGVTGHTIYSWEHGGSRPRAAQLVRLAAVRGMGKKDAMARLAQASGKVAKKSAKKVVRKVAKKSNKRGRPKMK